MIRITKDAILCVEFNIDANGVETESSFDILKTENGIVSYMDHFVAIDEGVLFGQLISLLGDAGEEIDYVFDAALNGQSVEIYLSELAEVSTNDGALTFTEIVHDATLGSDGVVSELTYIQGVGVDPKTGRLCDNSLELLPVNFYKDLPVMLNYNYAIQRMEEVSGQMVPFTEFKAKKGFTLYEVIYAIFYEISFHGTPAERKLLLDEILAVCEKAKADGEILALPAAVSAGKDIELARLKTEIEKALEEENYEQAAELRDRIKEINGDRG